VPSITDRLFTPDACLTGKGRGLRRLAIPCILLVLVLLGACGSPDVIVPPTEEFGGPEFAAVVLASDLGVGRERLAFGVVRRDGPPLRAESAKVRTYFLPPATDNRDPSETLTARFEEWPFSGGVFVVYPEFDVSGSWELETEFISEDGLPVTAKSAFTVKESSDTPSAGDSAPASDTLIAGDVPDLSFLSTAQTPDAALYAISIDGAIAAGKPFVVGFSTPRYCTTGTCGPQVEQLSDLRQRYGERANVIHVEIYKDPHLFEDGERPGKEDVVEAVLEWGLPTEPWTFVVDSEGIIRAKFEAYTPASSIEKSLLAVLN
jgi:hypothetical protein